MKNCRFKHTYLTLTSLAISVTLLSQTPDFSKVPNMWEGDSANIIYLINNGIKITDRKVICWFPKDSLSRVQMNDIASMINEGISGAEKFINAPQPWQVHQPSEPYTFFFRFDRFVSHASGAGFVSIPFWRIKEGKAPWLHEVMHEMLYCKSENLVSKTIPEKELDEKTTLWLMEGLPDYIALKVSLAGNLRLFDVFTNSYQPDADSLFVKEIVAEKGAYILSHIGTKGIMPELFSDERLYYAPCFYHGSSSFVKYIAEQYDVKTLLLAISSFGEEQETIETLTGKPIAILKKEWLNKLSILPR
ncbi:MAG TPA: hypothetical protein VH396_21955 [Chitinophagaceae bacterium]|jgi:hypothetical protein